MKVQTVRRTVRSGAGSVRRNGIDGSERTVKIKSEIRMKNGVPTTSGQFWIACPQQTRYRKRMKVELVKGRWGQFPRSS
jgi:hypothetical protein